MQRVQKIFNDVAVYLSQVETELRNLKISQDEIKEKSHKNEEKAELFRQILQSILKDFKLLTLSETNVNQAANCENDDKLITFMTQKCSEIDPLIREKVMRDNHFISDDFFFTNDVAKKKKEIQSIAEQSGPTFAILTAQFLSNEVLQNELLKYTTLQEKHSSEDSVTEEEKKDKMEQNIIENQQLQQQVEDITKQLNNYKSKAKKSLNSQMELQKADIEQKAQIKQLQIQVDNLKSELDVANMKLQVAQNDIEAKEHEKSELIEQFNNQLAQNIEEAVKSKVEEIEQLNTILKQTQIDNASAILQKNKQIKKQEEQFRREIGNLQDQIGAIVQKTEEKRKKQRRNQKLLEQQHQSTINEMNAGFELIKQNMNQVIEQLKEKVQQSNNSIEKLSQQLNQCENENKVLKTENENLANSQKKLQSEFNVMKNQIGKERQQISGQLAAQTMVYEAKIQKAVKEAKDSADKKINEFLEYSYSKFNGFYDIDGGEFGEESFKQLLTMIKSDLEKLNYFQNEATKFTPIK
ncbi:hypothetical protein TVAG_252440 [Trichomonas vaginalis G3]|uniref:Uncharacterized protein n=1 Tax=Trichomonas vaginalis (strain ATCC PRA-98 / G3) TaxID=412133 RepID=A2DVY6_TRIV3|nr:biological adhesion protein [Trichomonas vaginalis G3]EAY15431.1 hypothetical protein TVAG_252440 [Trichomonas vaginalis G3]KAI5499606.1 biological adhesion protein [Trichomonas vaginalis G3]|eukprot:XP_001327654.1 hypothetical protein [Trichomonas vaginalis G3]